MFAVVAADWRLLVMLQIGFARTKKTTSGSFYEQKAPSRREKSVERQQGESRFRKGWSLFGSKISIFRPSDLCFKEGNVSYSFSFFSLPKFQPFLILFGLYITIYIDISFFDGISFYLQNSFQAEKSLAAHCARTTGLFVATKE